MSLLEFNPVKKSSAMIDGTLSCTDFDLDAIYSYTELGGDVINLKYNNKKRSVSGEEECSTFNNQISIKMKNGSNIKIFNKGAFSISGSGTVDTAMQNSKNTLEILLRILEKIRFIVSIVPENCRGLYTIYKSRILTRKSLHQDEYICRHYIRNNKIIISGNECVEFTTIPGIYIDIKHKDKTKTLYNNMAEKIGKVVYNMKRKSKSLCIKDCTYKVTEREGYYNIINKYNTTIGVLEIYIHGSIEKVKLPETIKLEVTVCEPGTKIEKIKFSNYNCNTSVKLPEGTGLDRSKICEYLSNNDIQYTYDPCAYPGVKFCISDVKVTIFRSGSILFSSKKDIHLEAYPFVIKMLNEHILLPTVCETSITEEVLTIWDI